MARHWNWLCLLLTVALLGGCLHPLTSVRPTTTDLRALGSASEIQGRVRFDEGRQSQAVSVRDDIAPGATVSLIDTETQYTVGSTITKPNGDFLLSFGAGFRPDPTKAYYLEAVKGIKGSNELYNQAGAEAVRLRTVLFYRNGWVSLTNSTPGSISIGIGTTAVSAMLGLKVMAGESVTPATLIGCLNPDLVGPDAGYTQGPGNPFTQAQYASVYGQVKGALDYDQDPLRYISYNPVGGTFLKTGTVFTLSSLSPTLGEIGATVTLVGSNFTLAAVVRFNGQPTTPVRVYDNNTKLEVRVPLGATTGPVSLEIGGTVLAGDRFTVRGSDGHNTLDLQGRLLVVSRSFSTLSRVSMDGTVTKLFEKATTPLLDEPRSVTLDAASGSLYVACYGSQKILRFDYDPATGDLSNPTDWADVAHPAGLAIGADGHLYVATDEDVGTITRFRLSDRTPQGTYGGFVRPVGLGFDFENRLFVSEQGNANRITRLNPANADPATNKEPWGYISAPWGLAVDSAGNVFVASNSRGAVFKIDRTLLMTAYAAVSSPTGLELDAGGTLYVADGTGNRILKVAPGGSVLPFAFGVSTSYGFALDGSNNRYVALSNANAILKISPDGTTAQPFAMGIANPYGLTFRNGRLYSAHPDTGGITQFDPSGRAASYGRGLRAMAIGMDLTADATIAWGGKYHYPTFYIYNPSGGFDANTEWSKYPGLTQITAGGTVTDVRARLSGPRSIAAASGTFYLLNNDNRLVRMAPTGAPGAYSLTVLDDTLSSPQRVSLAEDGDPLVSDKTAGRVYRYDAQNGFVRSTLGGALANVFGVAADRHNGTLYVTTNPGNQLYKLVGGTWTLVPLSGVTLNEPRSIAVASPSGDVAIADWGSYQVDVVTPAGAASTSIALSYRPNDVDFATTGTLFASVDQCGSNLLRINLTTGVVVEYSSSGCSAPFPMSVDRADNAIYSANTWAQVLRNGSRIAEGPTSIRGEVLVHSSGVYCSSYDALYRFGPTGQPDLALHLDYAPQAMAAIGDDVYFTMTENEPNHHLYVFTNLATGAKSKLTTAPLPAAPRAMDARQDGLLEWVGADGRLYQMSANHQTATLLPVGLNQPDF